MKPPKVVDTLEDPTQFIEVRFASFLSDGFTTMAVMNPNWQNAPLCSFENVLSKILVIRISF